MVGTGESHLSCSSIDPGGHFSRLNDPSTPVTYLSTRLDGLHCGFRVDIMSTHHAESLVHRVFRGSKRQERHSRALPSLKLESQFRQNPLGDVRYHALRDYWPLLEVCARSLEEPRIFATTTGE